MEVFTIAGKKKDLFINEQIRAREVMVIGPNGEKLGTRAINDAITLANVAGFDLVLISPNANPPVCKIMDYNKYKYEQKKKAKDNIKKQKENNLEIKGCRLSPDIDIHDFDTKVRNVRKFLEKGHKVRVTIRFRGRRIMHVDQGKEVMERFQTALEEVSAIDGKITMEGNVMAMNLNPIKEK
jgi:translation initiation factor IF-3